MAIYNVSTSTELRQRIQAALTGDEIVLDTGGTYDSIGSLAKIICGIPFSYASGYVISGSNSTILDTRILQQNIDADLGPTSLVGNIDDLILSYTAGGANNGYAILSATRGSYNLNNLTITGQSEGWAGNGYKYMSLTTFDYSAPISVDLAIVSSFVDITGQGNFDPTLASGGGSAFLHSWNNSGTIILQDTSFDESGYLATFNFLNFSAPEAVAPTLGKYILSGNTFFRSNSAYQNVARSEGNRLGNVAATIGGNTFSNGSYLHLSGNLAGIKFSGTNTFSSITGGFGILVDGAVTTNPVIEAKSEVVFEGDGTPLYYKTSEAGNGVSLIANNAGGGLTINNEAFVSLVVGGQGDDTLSGSGNAYVLGDLGNDNISTQNGNDKIHGGSGNDTILSAGGSDTVLGEDGNDYIDAEANNDSIFGGNGNDTLLGGSGADSIVGGDGSDLIAGGAGNDTLTGGNDADTFQIANLDGSDTITDFTATGTSADKFAITGSGMNLTSGTVLGSGNVTSATALTNTAITPGSSFVNKLIKITSNTTTGSTATISTLNGNAYVLLFNGTNAQLYFDDNWTNINNRRLLATMSSITSLNGTLDLTNANFCVI